MSNASNNGRSICLILVGLLLVGCNRSPDAAALAEIATLQSDLAKSEARNKELEKSLKSEGKPAPVADNSAHLGISRKDYQRQIAQFAGYPIEFSAENAETGKWTATDAKTGVVFVLWANDNDMVDAATCIIVIPENYWLEDPKHDFKPARELASRFVTITNCGITFGRLEDMVQTLLDKEARLVDGLVLLRSTDILDCRVTHDWKAHQVRIDLSPK